MCVIKITYTVVQKLLITYIHLLITYITGLYLLTRVVEQEAMLYVYIGEGGRIKREEEIINKYLG